MTKPLRVRYAPSPTGDLHVGSLRTVIYNYLVARQSGGTFVMRIEDTDRARMVEGSARRQLEALRWMDLLPDEGVCLDEQGNLTEKGSYGPYTQSERLDIYKEHVERLLENGKAYRCFATAQELEEMRAEQQKNHLPPRYDRRYRNLPREESDARAAAGESHVIRQAMPLDGETSFTDAVRGTITYQCADLDDHVLLKSDGFPTYQLASVVDDHLMEIDLVMRGEEWVPSTPKNVLLYQAFGWEAPQFAHLPVILGPDGKKKLSKRDGDVSVAEYEAKGYLPHALFNFLAFLGWSPGTEDEFLTREQFVEQFRLEKVQKAAAACNFERLDFVNGWYIRQLPVEKLVEHLLPYWEEAGVTGIPQDYLAKVAATVQERLKHFDEAAAFTWFFFKRPAVDDKMRELIVPKKSDFESTIGHLKEVTDFLQQYEGAWEHDPLKDGLISWIAEREYKNGEVLWPVRAALTGEAASPGAFEMLTVLGKDESLERLKAVVV